MPLGLTSCNSVSRKPVQRLERGVFRQERARPAHGGSQCAQKCNFGLPRYLVDDVRAQKAFTIKEGYQLQLLANIFNIANHQNIDGINTTAYLLSSTGPLSGTATFQPTYGQITSSNNSGFLYAPRQIEIAALFSL
jgi:hypothetical protein